jgi:hypothetical protein
VPNAVTIPLLLGGLGLGLVHDRGVYPDRGVGGLVDSGACATIALMALLPWYARERFPAGGVKLQMGFAACVGAVYGMPAGIPIVLLAGVIPTAIFAALLRRMARRVSHGDRRTPAELPIGFVMGLVDATSVVSFALLARQGYDTSLCGVP